MGKIDLVRKVIIVEDNKPTQLDKLLKVLSCIRALAITAAVCKIAIDILDSKSFVEINKAEEDKEEGE